MNLSMYLYNGQKVHLIQIFKNYSPLPLSQILPYCTCASSGSMAGQTSPHTQGQWVHPRPGPQHTPRRALVVLPAPCPAQRAQGLSRAQRREGTGRKSAFAPPRAAAASLPRGPEARPRASSPLLPTTLGEAILRFSSLSQEQAAPSRSLPSAYTPTLGQPLSPAGPAAAPGPPAKLSPSAAAILPAPPTRAFSAGAARPAAWRRRWGGSWAPRCCGPRGTRGAAASARARATTPTEAGCMWRATPRRRCGG